MVVPREGWVKHDSKILKLIDSAEDVIARMDSNIPGTFLDRLKTVVLGVVHNYHNRYILRQAFNK